MLNPIVTQFTGSQPNNWRYGVSSAVNPAAFVVFGVRPPVTASRRLSFDLGETTNHDGTNERLPIGN